MAASDARPVPRKNVAYRVTFPIFDADGDLVTGAAGLDSEYSGDAGTFADCASEATEIATASGVYYLDLTAGELNYDTVAIIVKTSTSGAKTTALVLYPEEAGDYRADVTHISGDSAAADNLESACDNYSATRGLAGTALPAAAADAAGGLPISDAGGLDLDAKLGDPSRPTGSVTTDAGNSATSFETDLTSAVNDFWKDCLLLITSGALLGQVKKVTAYNGTTKIITVEGGFTGTPADGVTFLLVNR